MTERGLPIVDGAPACPFVAFEDDRDERAASPDHRHRCFAEVRPAPRALAHQEAYCLSSAFPVCPTFQDWARREAARARREEMAGAVDDTPRRNPPRDWTAPPPWLSDRPSRRDERQEPPIDDETDEQPEVVPIPPRGRGLSGGFADRLLGGASEETSEPRDEDVEDVGEASAPLPPEPRSASVPSGRARGLWDAVSQVRGGGAAADAGPYDDEDDEDEEDEGGAAAAAASAAAIASARRRGRDRDLGGPAEGKGAARDAASRGAGVPTRDRRDLDSPSWERPRRMEDYPALRSRRIPSFAVPSSLLLAVAAIAIAAVALFFLPTLLGIGNDNSGSASPTPAGAAGSAAPSTIAEASPTPAASQRIYIVQTGDLMTTIAKKFKVPLQALIDANKDTVPNPDVLKVGDQIIIPAPGTTAAPATPAPSQ